MVFYTNMVAFCMGMVTAGVFLAQVEGVVIVMMIAQVECCSNI